MAAQLESLPADTRRALERVVDDLHRLHLMTCASPGPGATGGIGASAVCVPQETTPAG
jgi:hypothetical protein